MAVETCSLANAVHVAWPGLSVYVSWYLDRGVLEDRAVSWRTSWDLVLIARGDEQFSSLEPNGETHSL